MQVRNEIKSKTEGRNWQRPFMDAKTFYLGSFKTPPPPKKKPRKNGAPRKKHRHILPKRRRSPFCRVLRPDDDGLGVGRGFDMAKTTIFSLWLTILNWWPISAIRSFSMPISTSNPYSWISFNFFTYMVMIRTQSGKYVSWTIAFK